MMSVFNIFIFSYGFDGGAEGLRGGRGRPVLRHVTILHMEMEQIKWMSANPDEKNYR